MESINSWLSGERRVLLAAKSPSGGWGGAGGWGSSQMHRCGQASSAPTTVTFGTGPVAGWTSGHPAGLGICLFALDKTAKTCSADTSFHVGSLWLLEIHAWKNEQNGMKELPINTGLLVFLREKTNVTLKNRTCGNARLLLLGAEAEALAKPLRQSGRTQSSSETQDSQA